MSPTREQRVDRSVGAIAPSWKIAGRGRLTTRPVFRPRPPTIEIDSDEAGWAPKSAHPGAMRRRMSDPRPDSWWRFVGGVLLGAN